ncbi:MAG: tRNA (adenosine(37)-N6)-threonylcarbamoyltransferase complex transferase subunit TsaD [Sandaracinaceae bacterium]|nr:tRNA (adenosine(37)-N6)-threonylcarbamoyltransferase complex transferase subunit TsaD [Sandaracinaceae bacterium]
MSRIHILGIESSCDETAAAIVDETGLVKSDVVASQIQLHAPFGGVVPEIDARAHLQQIARVVREAVAPFEGGLDAIDAIAVTQGPGLVGALLVGTSMANAMAFSLDKPLVYVNHLEGHLFAPFLRRDEEEEIGLTFPYIALLASGGHTAIYRVSGPKEIHLIGQTRDDAAGEAYDKAAKVLGLGYPGGPVIDRLASNFGGEPERFAIPMQGKRTMDFSFAGLKTALARRVAEELGDRGGESRLSDERIGALAAGFQEAVVQSLVRTTLRAAEAEGIDRVVITGGVAANSGLRVILREKAAERGIRVFIPPFANCTDNAAMIAYRGMLDFVAGDFGHLGQPGSRSEHSGQPGYRSPYSRDPLRRRGKFNRRGELVPRESKKMPSKTQSEA